MKMVQVGQVLNNAKFSKFHLHILLWGLVILLFDGFDLVVYGAVVPSIMEEWSITAVEAGALGSYATFGMMVGAALLGTLSDRFSRKKVIILCVAIFSIFTVVIPFAATPLMFGICRFIAGVGLGGVMPNIITLMGEYAPGKLRAFLITTMCSGYAIGGVISSALSINIIGNFGWQSVFYIGGIPILLLPFIVKFLPDSPQAYLRNNNVSELGKVLEKVIPSYRYEDGDNLQLETKKDSKIPVLELFRSGRAFSTVLLWANTFLLLIVLYGLNTWLPKLMVDAGFELNSSLLLLLALNFGGIIGSIFGGWLSDRWNPKYVLSAFYISGVVALIGLSFKPAIIVMFLLIIVAGGTSIGSQIIANAFVNQYYPEHMKSTGLGWSLGVGRIGAVVGPMLGGILVSLNLSLQFNFLVFAGFMILAIVCVTLVKTTQDHFSKSFQIGSVKEDEDGRSFI